MKLNERKLDNALKGLGVGAAVLVALAIILGAMTLVANTLGITASYIFAGIVLLGFYGFVGYMNG